jgi:hypothetical protein
LPACASRFAARNPEDFLISVLSDMPDEEMMVQFKAVHSSWAGQSK